MFSHCMIPKNLKNVTQRQYIYNDFDRDGLRNVDDPKPFNKKEVVPQKTYKSSGYQDRDVKLSEELRAIEHYNNARKPFLKKFLRENKGSFGRIKSVPSTIKKLRERFLEKGLVGDVAGATILTRKRKGAYRKAANIQRRYKYDPDLTDDYYKNPMKSHYALHYGLFDNRNTAMKMELQVKSKKMNEVDDLVHAYYKKNKSAIPKKFTLLARKLYEQGY